MLSLFDRTHLFTGAVVANRLSEIKDWNILLLEAGSDRNILTDIPILAAEFQLGDQDWQYKTSPQGTTCLGNNTKK